MRVVIAGIVGAFAGPTLLVGFARYLAWIVGMEITEQGRSAMLVFGIAAAVFAAIGASILEEQRARTAREERGA